VLRGDALRALECFDFGVGSFQFGLVARRIRGERV
jgi:hypothetical protein